MIAKSCRGDGAPAEGLHGFLHACSAMPSRKRARAAPAAASAEAVTCIEVGGGGQKWCELANMWRADELLDCQIRVQARTFRAHRLAVSACSAFLRGCFCSGLAESESASVTLEDVSSSTFEAVLTWIYDGKVTVDESALPQLLEAAARLQVAELEDEVERLVAERITPANAIDAWILADSLTRPALVDAAKAVVLASFSEAAAVDSFVSLPLSALETLLASDELDVQDESEVFTHLKRWIAAQHPAVTAAAQAKLLGCVRFAHMDPAFVREQVNTDPLISSSQQNTLIVAQAFQQVVFGSSPHRRTGGAIDLIFSAPFDTNGVLYHIATDGGKRAYSNPHTAGLVLASMSSAMTARLLSQPENFVAHAHATPVHCFTKELDNSWMAVDLGEGRALKAEHYCLRSDKYSDYYKLRNWELQASNDGQAWTTLRRHANDTQLAMSAMSEAAWPVEPTADGIAYRHFRILQTGPNSSGNTHLMCAGIELYGKLTPARV